MSVIKALANAELKVCMCVCACGGVLACTAGCSKLAVSCESLENSLLLRLRRILTVWTSGLKGEKL